jgi:drug/metabolite transporter (DMT)-like permease
MGFRRTKLSGNDLATLAGIIAILLWASNIAFSRSVMDKEGSMNAAFYIYIYSAVFIFFVILIFQPRAFLFFRNKDLPLPFHLKSILFFTLNNVLLFVAIGMAEKNEELVIVALLNYTWPLLVYIIGIPVRGLKIPPGTLIAAVILGLAGISMAILQGYDTEEMRRILKAGNDNLPAYLAFMTAVSWALYSNLTAKYKSSDDLANIPVVFLISGLVFLTILFFTGKLSSVHLKAPLENPEQKPER